MCAFILKHKTTVLHINCISTSVQQFVLVPFAYDLSSSLSKSWLCIYLWCVFSFAIPWEAI